MEVESSAVERLQAEAKEAGELAEQAKEPRVKQGLLALAQQFQTELLAEKIRDAPLHGHEGAQKEQNGTANAPSVTVGASDLASDAPQAPPVPVPVPKSAATAASEAALSAKLRYVPVERFAWDQGEYNAPWVTVYVEIPGVGQAKDHVTCDFAKDAFDLKVEDLEGKSYRLVKNNLEKEVVPGECKFIVKRDRVLIKLKKVKGEFSYEHWSDLTAKRKKDHSGSGGGSGSGAAKDPSAGIMDMMRDMYESGDDNMRRIIGESMEKAYTQKQNPGLGDGGMGGMSGLGGMGGMSGLGGMGGIGGMGADDMDDFGGL